MNFLSQFAGKGNQTAPASKSVAPTESAVRTGQKEEGVPPTVRLKPYTGLEIKTLWNHFNKDDLITINELSELLDRILVKDATDVFTAIRGSKGWKEYCSQALKYMDTSRGNTIDLQEFSSQFNGFYQTRFYYIVKHLVPAVLKELKKICRECDIDASRIAELDAILIGEVPAAPQPVVVDTSSKDEMKQLKAMMDNLTNELEQNRGDLRAAQGKIIQLKDLLSQSEAQYQDLRPRFETEHSYRVAAETEIQKLRAEISNLQSAQNAADSYKRELDRSRTVLDSVNEDLFRAREENKRLVEQNRNDILRLEGEISALRKEIDGRDTELIMTHQKSEKFERESLELKNGQAKLIEEWKHKFDEVLKENEKCRTVMADLRSEVIRVNTALVEAQNADQGNEKNGKVSSIYAASLSGVGLDPLRSELVRQFGSIDAVVGKRARLTLHELESMALTMGYSREYCRKLFYALDVKNRGFLSGEQFSRPLPLLHRELCLLTQAQVQTRSIQQTN